MSYRKIVRFRSTRGGEEINLGDALRKGLAMDGGLFVPSSFPRFNPDDFGSSSTFQSVAIELLWPFFQNSLLEDSLTDIVKSALNFDIPLVKNEGWRMLDLTQGPTNAFKDIGARFLARALSHLDGTKTILVATSGDTGSAVASAFHNVEGTEVVILFPNGKISKIQEKQLTCWDSNILSLKVDGDFDDCQRIVKSIFSSDRGGEFGSANSINIGRLLPQCTYYAYSSLISYQENGGLSNYIIPTGNMGNAIACIWAKIMGFPIGHIVMSTNANKVIPDFFETRNVYPRKSKRTLANAMDVGNPSNLERFIDLLQNERIVTGEISAHSVSDHNIRNAIHSAFDMDKRIICPHTATAYHVYSTMKLTNYIIVSTANPAKFKDIVEPILGFEIPFPPQMQELLSRKNNSVDVGARADQVLNKYKEWRK